MTKAYKIGTVVYLFEVEGVSYKIPHPSLGLTAVKQQCYMPILGSIARYDLNKGLNSMEVVNEDLDFPEDGCVDANPFQMYCYEKLPLI